MVNRAAEAGAHDVLAADLRRIQELDRVRAPFGLYFALGEMDPTNAPPHIKIAADDPDDEAGEYPLEYEALCHVTRHVFGAGFKTAGPGVLRQLAEDPCWKIDGYRTAGAFGKRGPLDARDLLRDLNGDDEGIGTILYTGSACTTNRGRWPVFLTEIMGSLERNGDWASLVHVSGQVTAAKQKLSRTPPGSSDRGVRMVLDAGGPPVAWVATHQHHDRLR